MKLLALFETILVVGGKIQNGIQAQQIRNDVSSQPKPTYIPNTNTLISTVTGGAVGGALAGSVGGPLGAFSGAIAGASIAGATVVFHDALEINKSITKSEIKSSNG